MSQEFVSETPPSQDRRLAQRLGRLEELMEKLVSRTPGSGSGSGPESTPKPVSPDDSPATTAPFAGLAPDSPDIFSGSAANNARHVAQMSTGKTPLNDVSLPTPQSLSPSSSSRPAARTAKYRAITAQLRDLFPPLETLYAISQQSPGAKYVLAAFYSQQDQMDGKPEPISALACVPDASSHPALVAKRLLQLAICLQQMPPFFDPTGLALKKSPSETMDDWVAAAGRLVTSDDDLVGSLEGLECLILQSFFQSDAGHLRKAWMTCRRALNMAQLMGIDRKGAKSIRSCDPLFDPRRQPSPLVLWFRINCCDRYLSLVLGLPVGSRDDTYLTSPSSSTVEDPPSDKLGKVYAVISGKIADRNLTSGPEAYVATQAIDLEMEQASKMMDEVWWKLPDMAICCSSSDTCADDMSAVKLQVRHFSLLVLLHLPYLLKDREQRRYEYNRATCMQASRDVLVRFLEFRNTFVTAVSGRHVDYSALVAAMTLLLGYLGAPWPGYEAKRAQDRELAETVMRKMRDMGAVDGDRLCLESAETIRQLLPIVRGGNNTNNTPGSAAAGDKTVHLSVPFLGTVNIHPGPTPPSSHAPSGLPSTGTTPVGANPGAILSDTPQSLCFDPPMAQHPCSYISMDGGLDPACPGNEMSPFTSDWPCFTADLEDWALQGVDTTYWSMVNNSNLN